MTITPDMILTALHQKLEETFPGEPVYDNLTPRGFQRPSNLLELERTDLDPQSLGMAAVSLRYQYKITTFAETDEVHASHLPTLDIRGMMILGMLGSGYVKVGSVPGMGRLYGGAVLCASPLRGVDRFSLLCGGREDPGVRGRSALYCGLLHFLRECHADRKTAAEHGRGYGQHLRICAVLEAL